MTHETLQFLENLLAFCEQAFPIACILLVGYCIARIPDLIQSAINDAESDT